MLIHAHDLRIECIGKAGLLLFWRGDIAGEDEYAAAILYLHLLELLVVRECGLRLCEEQRTAEDTRDKLHRSSCGLRMHREAGSRTPANDALHGERSFHDKGDLPADGNGVGASCRRRRKPDIRSDGVVGRRIAIDAVDGLHAASRRICPLWRRGGMYDARIVEWVVVGMRLEWLGRVVDRLREARGRGWGKSRRVRRGTGLLG